MNITGPSNFAYSTSVASTNAQEGIREQLTRLDQNVAEVARGEESDASGSRDRALVEQNEIVRAVRASARAL